MTQPSPLLTTRQAAELLGCSHDTVARKADKGLIRHKRDPHGTRWFRLADIQKLLEAQS